MVKLPNMKKPVRRAVEEKRAGKSTVVLYGVLALLFVGLVAFLGNLLTGDVVKRKKESITTIKLLKPPPPEQKPPEPEPMKEPPKEVVETIQTPQQAMQNTPEQNSNAPQGSDLGVDAEGGAGGDGFGLVGRKGGRALTLGGGGGGAGSGLSRMSLLAKYGWYTKKVEKELWQRVKLILDKDGGIPDGKHKMTVHLEFSLTGQVVKSRVVGSSGHDKIDEAVKIAMQSLKVSEPLPEGMPRAMTIRIASQG